MAGAHRMDDPGEQVRGGKTPGDVVNQHDPVVVFQRPKARLDRGRTIKPSGHDLHPGPISILAVVTDDLPELTEVRVGRHDDHVCHLGTTKNAPKCVSQ